MFKPLGKIVIIPCKDEDCYNRGRYSENHVGYFKFKEYNSYYITIPMLGDNSNNTRFACEHEVRLLTEIEELIFLNQLEYQKTEQRTRGEK